jgi:hypothetical protein
MFESGKEATRMANIFEEFLQVHGEVVEEAIDDAIDNTIDELTGKDDDHDED